MDKQLHGKQDILRYSPEHVERNLVEGSGNFVSSDDTITQHMSYFQVQDFHQLSLFRMNPWVCRSDYPLGWRVYKEFYCSKILIAEAGIFWIPN